jgi:hypothetical protein
MRKTPLTLGFSVAVLCLLANIEAGCGSTQTADTVPVKPHTVTIEACGSPTRFPVSPECMSMMDYPYGPLLQQKSNLLMAVWRACPSADPCEPVRKSAPACQKMDTLKAGTAEFEDVRSKCVNAQSLDYSCHALRSDPEVKLRTQTAGNCMEKCPAPSKGRFVDKAARDEAGSVGRVLR